MEKFRIRKVNSNYGAPMRLESDNPYDLYIVEKYNGFLFGWSAIRSSKYSYRTFEYLKEAEDFKIELETNYKKSKMKKGQIVSPKVKVNRMTIGKKYVIHRTDGDCIFIMDDFNIERMCYKEDFILVEKKWKLCDRIRSFFNFEEI
jgi:hypothetical protein